MIPSKYPMPQPKKSNGSLNGFLLIFYCLRYKTHTGMKSPNYSTKFVQSLNNIVKINANIKPKSTISANDKIFTTVVDKKGKHIKLQVF